jgi:predicted double-glycine peptidase
VQSCENCSCSLLAHMNSQQKPLKLPSNLIPIPLIRQSTNYTCGVAALQSILYAYANKDYREDRLAKKLKATSEDGTDHREIVAVAREFGFEARAEQNMGLEKLKSYVDNGIPVIVAIQAWCGEEGQVDWKHRWDDGHYCVVVGYDEERLFFMDPSTPGNYTYIPVQEFLDRWHDIDQRKEQVIQLGIILAGKKNLFNPQEVIKMN